MAKIKEVLSFEDKMLKLEDRYGKGAIVQASNSTFERVTDYTSTGSMTLDLATGIGGVPKCGKITYIIGKESAGKTTIALHIIAEEQKKSKDAKCAFCDVENTLDLNYAENIGCDLKRFYVLDVKTLLRKRKPEDMQKVSGEEWLQLACDLIETKEFGIVVLDSIAELCPMAELTAGIASAGIAPMGRMLSKALRTICATLAPTNTGLVLLNQYRVSPGAYGNPYIDAAGEALKYYIALKIEITKALDKDADGVYGLDIKAKITKSKVSIPYKEALLYIEFGKGIQRVNEVVELAEEYKLFDKSGSHYSYKGSKIANGKDALLQFCKDNEEFAIELETEVMKMMNGKVAVTQEEEKQAKITV